MLNYTWTSWTLRCVSVMMTTSSLLEAKTAPLAGGGCMLMPSIDLNILHWMNESQFVDAGATGSVAVNLHHWEGIDQLLRICLMSFH